MEEIHAVEFVTMRIGNSGHLIIPKRHVLAEKIGIVAILKRFCSKTVGTEKNIVKRRGCTGGNMVVNASAAKVRPARYGKEFALSAKGKGNLFGTTITVLEHLGVGFVGDAMST